MSGREEGCHWALVDPEGATAAKAAAFALKPRERSSGPARIVVDDDVAQSAVAPASDGCCLVVVATMTMIITKLYMNKDVSFDC